MTEGIGIAPISIASGGLLLAAGRRVSAAQDVNLLPLLIANVMSRPTGPVVTRWTLVRAGDLASGHHPKPAGR